MAECFAGLLEWTLDHATVTAPETFSAVQAHIERCFEPSPVKIRVFARDKAASLHSALQRYIARRTAAGQPVEHKTAGDAALSNMVATLQAAYPDIAGPVAPSVAPAKMPPADSVTLRFISVAKQNAPTDRAYWAGTYSTTTCGDNVLVDRKPSPGYRGGFLEIRPDLSSVEIPAPPSSLFHAPDFYFDFLSFKFLPSSDGLYEITGNGTFLHYRYASHTWTDASAELGREASAELRGKPLPTNAIVGNISFRTVNIVNGIFYTAASEGGFTIGRVKNGAFELIASTRRRPAEHPLDEMNGARVSQVFAGAGGRPCAALAFPDHTEIHDLELRRSICSLSGSSLGGYAEVSISGKVPVLEDIKVVAVIDPDTGSPRTLIRRSYTRLRNFGMLDDDLPLETVWDWPSDLSVDSAQDVNGVTIARAVHGDHLFVLKCQHSLDFAALNKLDLPSHDVLTLLCYRPGHRDPLEIPLAFDATVLAPFGLGVGAKSAMPLQPEFAVSHVRATSAGLFFQFNDRWLPENGKKTPKPGLLHLAWKDVDDWLVRHGQAAIRADAIPGASKPTR